MTVGPGDDGGAQLDDDPLGGRQLLPAQEGRLPTLLLQAQRGAVALVYRVETPVVTQNKRYITKRWSNCIPVILIRDSSVRCFYFNSIVPRIHMKDFGQRLGHILHIL